MSLFAHIRIKWGYKTEHFKKNMNFDKYIDSLPVEIATLVLDYADLLLIIVYLHSQVLM